MLPFPSQNTIYTYYTVQHLFSDRKSRNTMCQLYPINPLAPITTSPLQPHWHPLQQYRNLSLPISTPSFILLPRYRYIPAIEAFERAIAINPVLGRGALKRHLQQCLDANASINRRLQNQAALTASYAAFVETST